MASTTGDQENSTYFSAQSPGTAAVERIESSASIPLPRNNYVSRWFQLGMFLVFLTSLIITLTVKSDTLRMSPGLISGGTISLFSVICVIYSYCTEQEYQRHPNPLIFWRTIADTIFVVRLLAEQFIRCLFYECKPLCNNLTFQCGCAQGQGAHELCIFMAGILEFSILAAECWFLCMSVNLYLSLSNPFSDFKRNMKYFHIFSWGSGAFAAVMLMSIPALPGYSILGFCWTNAIINAPRVDPKTCPIDSGKTNILRNSDGVFQQNASSWFYFYIWIVLILIIALSIWIWAWRRLSEGMPETYAVRVKSIHQTRFYVIVVTLYWFTALLVYVSHLSGDYTTTLNEHTTTTNELMNFLLACRGYVDLVIWFTLNDFKLPRCFASSQQQQDPRTFSLMNLTILNQDTNQIDLSPQVNAALRREVLFYTTSGILQAIQTAEQLPQSQRIQHLALLPQTSRASSTNISSSMHMIPPNVLQQRNSDGVSTSSAEPMENHDADNFLYHARQSSKKHTQIRTFHDYEPHAFRRIRDRFGMDNDRYINSLSSTTKERLSEGASGAFMFFSGDGSLIVKSTSKEELKFLRTIAGHYADYLCHNPNSLLTRFYGAHCLELYGQTFNFIVMANVFNTDLVIHNRYDIKGSWVNRNSELPKAGKKVTCRHCNRKYIYQGSRYNDFNCPLRLGGHEPNVVLKDNDLTEKLRIPESHATKLYKQLEQDSRLLSNFGIMDYSLLMGVHDVEYVVNNTSSTLSSSPSSSFSLPEKSNLTNESTDPIPVSTAAAVNPFSAHSVMESSTVMQVHSNKKKEMSSTATDGDESKQAAPTIGLHPEDPTRKRSFQSPHVPRTGMRLANSVMGPAYYYVGIIDILQTWTLSKRAERWIKTSCQRVDGDGLSAIPPNLYRVRFMSKMATILGIVNAELDQQQRLPENIFAHQHANMDLDPTSADGVSVHLHRSLTTNNHLITRMYAPGKKNPMNTSGRDLLAVPNYLINEEESSSSSSSSSS